MLRKMLHCCFAVVLMAGSLYSQGKKSSFLDALQKRIKVRKSFDTPAETKKPALFTLSKNDDEQTLYAIDLAILYKNISSSTFELTPIAQFDYSSSPKKPSQKISAGMSAYWIVHREENSSSSGRIEPSLFLSKDFWTEFSKINGSIVYVPDVPEFFVPIRNATELEYAEDGSDRDVWFNGFLPIVGLGYEKEIGDKGDTVDIKALRSIIKSQLTFRVYYYQIDLSVNYEKEFQESKRTFLDYALEGSFYLDQKERASISASLVINREPSLLKNTRFTLGFGIKL